LPELSDLSLKDLFLVGGDIDMIVFDDADETLVLDL
jgi:hypothetical protein